MQRNVFGVWVHVPCVDGVGSCYYADVCNFGKPENVQCPPRFEKNGVPCRCPIEQVNYPNLLQIIYTFYYIKIQCHNVSCCTPPKRFDPFLLNRSTSIFHTFK